MDKGSTPRLPGNPVHVLITGEPGAGKTSFVYALLGRECTPVPTLGVELHECEAEETRLAVWDFSSGGCEVIPFIRSQIQIVLVFIKSKEEVIRLAAGLRDSYPRALVLPLVNQSDWRLRDYSPHQILVPGEIFRVNCKHRRGILLFLKSVLTARQQRQADRTKSMGRTEPGCEMGLESAKEMEGCQLQ